MALISIGISLREGHGLFRSSVALATPPLVIASNVVAGQRSVAPYQSQDTQPWVWQCPRLLTVRLGRITRRSGYYAAPRAVMDRALLRVCPGYDGRGYYRSGPSVSAPVKSSARNLKGVRKGGRPPRADALKLRAQILEVATDLFLEQGYGSTSIEAVAGRAGVSKRTFYDRFDDKAALFAAVVHRIIENIRPPANVPLLAGPNLGEILRRLAGLILQAALSPQAIALHRLVTGESSRFPELASALRRTAARLKQQPSLLDCFQGIAKDQIKSRNQAFAAHQFIYR